MVKVSKLTELNPDPKTFNVNNYWCSTYPYQAFAGDVIDQNNNGSTNANFSFSFRV